jgi:N-acetyl-anhydromuramyl-L-alanine amidase AmpD
MAENNKYEDKQESVINFTDFLLSIQRTKSEIIKNHSIDGLLLENSEREEINEIQVKNHIINSIDPKKSKYSTCIMYSMLENNALEEVTDESIDTLNSSKPDIVKKNEEANAKKNKEKLSDEKVDVSKISTEIDTSQASTIHTSPRKLSIEYLVIHYTAGTTSRLGKAKDTCNVFKTREASADFIVDDGSIMQYNPDPLKYYCWAVGDKGSSTNNGGTYRGKAKNGNSIHIEVCSSMKPGGDWKTPNHDGWYFTTAVLNNAIKLAKILMKKYNIPSSKVIRHYDVTGKLCPGVPGWNLEKGSYNEDQWLWFKRQIS